MSIGKRLRFFLLLLFFHSFFLALASNWRHKQRSTFLFMFLFSRCSHSVRFFLFCSVVRVAYQSSLISLNITNLENEMNMRTKERKKKKKHRKRNEIRTPACGTPTSSIRTLKKYILSFLCIRYEDVKKREINKMCICEADFFFFCSIFLLGIVAHNSLPLWCARERTPSA